MVRLNRRRRGARFRRARIPSAHSNGAVRIGRGRKSFYRVLALNPRAAVAEVELSKLQLFNSKGKESVLSANRAIALQPENLEAKLSLPRGLIASGDLVRGEAALVPLEASYPENSQVLTLRGTRSRSKGFLGARKAFAMRWIWTDSVGFAAACELNLRKRPCERRCSSNAG